MAVQNNAIQNLIPLMFSSFYATYEGDGNPLDGLAKVGSGDHSLGKAIDSGKASVVQVAYENFAEATKKAAKILAPVGAALAVPYEMAEKVVTFLDQRTGQIISRKWNSLDPYTQNLIKGFGKIISVTYLAKEAGAILNISKELDAAKLAQVAKNLSAGDSAKNIANAQRLAQQLRLESAKSPFTEAGTLKKEVIDGATSMVKIKLNNPSIPPGFLKYETKTFQSPSGDFRMHFYKNPTTEEVFYGLDYKAVFNEPFK